MRKLAIFTGAFSAGAFLAQYLLPEPWLLPCAAAAFLLALARLFLPIRTGRVLLLVGVGLCVSLGNAWLFAREVQRPMEAWTGTTQTVAMTVCDYAIPTNFGAKAPVEIEGLPGKVMYYGDAALLNLDPGQTVYNTVYFQSASRIRDDDVTSFTSKGIFLLAYSKGEETFDTGSSDSLRWLPIRVGKAVQEKIDELYSGDTAGFLTAILTGDKSALSEQGKTDLSEAGLYHILAVSGMHCGFLLSMIALLVSWHRRRLIAAIAIPLLIFYAFLVGGSPSVVRACMMLGLLLAAPLFHRDSDGPTSLLTALCLILVWNPCAAASISLQLSFGAVAGILWLTPKLYRMFMDGKKRNALYRFLVSGFSATMGALVFTIPLSSYYFGVLVLISPISNLLCLFAASVVFITGLTSVLLGFLWMPLGVAASAIPKLFAGYILEVAGLLAQIPYHAVYFVNPYLKYWLAFAYLLFLTAWLCKPKIRRKYALAALLSAAALVAAVRINTARYDGDMEIHVLDVGQGQSVLFSSENTFALVDCGSGNSWYDPGTVAADHLMTMGCKELDYLILTHYDSDHANGVETLMARLPINTILVPSGRDDDGLADAVRELAFEHGIKVCSVNEAETFEFGKAELRVLPPAGGEKDNERGLVVLATLVDRDFLITGDISAAAERRLLAEYVLPDVEYLVAGHHGSKTSTSEDLLEAVMPETVFISVGRGNSYGHPAEDALRRMAEHECVVYRTDLHGNIRISLKMGN